MAQAFTQEIRIQNAVGGIDDAIQTFEAFSQKHEIPKEIMQKIRRVIVELLSNMIQYGSPKGQEAQVSIQLELLSSGRLSIKMYNEGVPFNPFQITPPNTAIPLEHREIGGLGIHLVRRLMDEYSYQRTTDCNVISMCKNQV